MWTSVHLCKRGAIVAWLLSAACACAQDNSSGDEAILAMSRAYRQKDSAALSALLPATQGHALQAWAAYWDVSARLETASAPEVDAFLQRYAQSYQEDRLRNEWLLLLGQRRDWSAFARYHSAYRMRDDPQVACYALYIQTQQGRAQASDAQRLRSLWFAQHRNAQDACDLAAQALHARGIIGAADVWRKARLAMRAGRMGAARAAVGVIDSAAAERVRALFAAPQAHLDELCAMPQLDANAQALAELAFLRLAASNTSAAAQTLQQAAWTRRLDRAQRNRIWGAIGRQYALNMDAQASSAFAQVKPLSDLDDEDLGWMVRAALRQGQWAQVRSGIEAMEADTQAQAIWTYWMARALQASKEPSAQAQALALYERIAGSADFYAQLAAEALGQRQRLPAAPEAPDSAVRAAVRNNPGLQEALGAWRLGLHNEGVRQWNYSTSLHQPGGMSDPELLAAAQWACEQQWWDRCINTSLRTRKLVDIGQRFPMPYRSAISAYSAATDVDAALVYGLIRQESRFAQSARSGAGAGGLMQVMPATARWTARKLGIPYSAATHNDLQTNLQLGMGYLRLVLDDFGASAPLALAAYNAGPNRPRRWRNGPVLEGAIWVENIPISETRNYVKNVLSNTVQYAALMANTTLPSLQEQLGTVAPLAANAPDPSLDLP